MRDSPRPLGLPFDRREAVAAVAVETFRGQLASHLWAMAVGFVVGVGVALRWYTF